MGVPRAGTGGAETALERMEIRPDGERLTRVELSLGGGEPVSWLTIVDFTMRVGAARLRMGGIAGVGTDENHRYKGYSRRCMEAAVAHMTAEGYDCSMLFGIADYYPKWGYATAIPWYRVTATAEAIERSASGATLEARPLTPEDHPAALALEEAFTALRSGTLDRRLPGQPHITKGSGWESAARPVGVFSPKKGLVGYYVADADNAGMVSELCLRDRAHACEVSRALSDDLRREGRDAVEMLLPPDHPYVEFLERFGVRCEVTYPYRQDIMLRICNLVPMMRKVAVELERHLCRHPCDALGALTFQTDLGAVTLRSQLHRVEVSEEPCRTTIRMPQWVLMQILMRYRSLADALTETGVEATDDVSEAWLRLFPRAYPFIWKTDAF